ncbi:aldehyde dehydrogenase family protein [Galactobacter valiniphilus]|uniref:L-glutamate gamma-semialdehyde dehydrogenase n=1 Tax=Galactobacter valiniphilus TaxID=2676122 RepID=A0A399JG02_9MICC|nr:bifunctional proline dehydrogenase/L-glutamate gamma-semialdehyde dehydrogenase [Galactobacter valiniphilus]RII43567.1 aldehyde dehydrogenase family protein [Galactobacter valiniphilus]
MSTASSPRTSGAAPQGAPLSSRLSHTQLPAAPDAGAARPWDLADQSVAQVRSWLSTASTIPADVSAQRLAGVLKDPAGLDFTVGFVDRVVRPEDLRVAAHELKALAPKVPAFLPWYLKAAVRIGGVLAPVLPGVVVPIARRALRSMVGHLIIDATDARLGKSIAKLRGDGTDLNINLLGEAILGEDEADRRLAGTLALIQRPDVDYVSIKVSATVAPHNHWAFDEAVDHIVEKMRPLYRAARDSSPRTFINLDMEEYKDLDLTLAVFKRLLSEDEFSDVRGGIVLQAYLPDALGAMIELQEFAAARVAAGGAPIKVRVVKGANLPMEQVEAKMHGWEQTVWDTKQGSDASYKAVLDYALYPERLANLQLGIAGHNLFDVALAHQLMQARGITSGTEFEMLLGMATSQAEAVRRDVGSLLLYTPVVHPSEFDVAIAYLIRRLEEGASQENFMSAVFELDAVPALFAREEERFRAALGELRERASVVPGPRRPQDRASETLPAIGEHTAFENTPDSDPDLPGNRAWGREIVSAMASTQLGEATIAAAHLNTEEQLEAVVAASLAAAPAWRALGAEGRAAVLHRAGEHLEARRADLLAVMGAETGKTIDQGDPEVSEAIDFAHYYARLGLELEQVDGATAVPVNLTVVTPPWNFPVAIPAGSTLSALAAGSTVIIKPAELSKRSGAVMIECLWAAFDDFGVSRDVLALVHLGERELGTQLVSHPAVGRLILTGGYETAQLFRGFRPDLPLLAETSGKNAIIVTPSADLDLAARDVVLSAFGHAGQKCSAASLVILVGRAATSKRFHRQLIDAARSLKVGWPTDPRTQMGPVVEVPQEKLQRGLTQLGQGESWALKPASLDDSGRLFSPGVRVGVQPGSEYHLTEYFGPVLGVMTAATLEEAVEHVNAIDYGLTSGIHSLDAEEIAYWAEHVEAGNLYINRGITGAIVQRQPFGGWKRSAVGAGTKAGGPNYLVGLSQWEDAAPAATQSTLPDDAASRLVKAATAVLPEPEAAWLRAASGADVAAASRFEGSRDVSKVGVEINALRYRPVPVTVRSAGASAQDVAQTVRVVAAGLRAHAATVKGAGTAAAPTLSVSVPTAFPEAVTAALRSAGVAVYAEDLAGWEQRAARAAQAGPREVERLRIAGPDAPETVAATFAATQGRPDVAVYAEPVTSAGRVEMLPFVREQAVSMTAHRFGTVNDLAQRALGEITLGDGA